MSLIDSCTLSPVGGAVWGCLGGVSVGMGFENKKPGLLQVDSLFCVWGSICM